MWPLRTLVDAVLTELSPRFSTLYAKTGRPSVAPVRLLRALLLQVLYCIRTKRQLMEQLGWIFLFGLAAYNLIRLRNLTWAPA